MATDADQHEIFRFLVEVKRLLSFLVHKRIPEQSRRPYISLFEADIAPRLDSVLGDVRTIESEEDRRWLALGVFGLVGDSLRFKVSEFFSWLSIGKVRNILKSANSILGSLSKVFALLDPVKEFKDHLELRIGDDCLNSDDDEIVDLGL